MCPWNKYVDKAGKEKAPAKSNENHQAQRAASSSCFCCLPPLLHGLAACCHISHATLCPLMSMPDICHGPCPTYIIHLRLRIPRPSFAVCPLSSRRSSDWSQIGIFLKKAARVLSWRGWGACGCGDPQHMLVSAGPNSCFCHTKVFLLLDSMRGTNHKNAIFRMRQMVSFCWFYPLRCEGTRTNI